MVKIKRKGIEEWDDSERMEYLEDFVKLSILPKIKPTLSDVIEGEDTPF
jgi:hypothetical protein